MSDDTAVDTSGDPSVTDVGQFLNEFLDSTLDAIHDDDVDDERVAELEAARDNLDTALRSLEDADAGPSLAERIEELEAEIKEYTIQKDIIRRVLAAHGLSDDQVDTLLTDMEDVSEQLRADDEDAA